MQEDKMGLMVKGRKQEAATAERGPAEGGRSTKQEKSEQPRPPAPATGEGGKKKRSSGADAGLILFAVLSFLVTLGVVLAWKTDYLDRWLPDNVRIMFGRSKGDQPEADTEKQDENGEAEDQPEADEEEQGEGETEDQPEADETADWKTYTNNKYNYSFKYPADYTYGPCSTKPCGNFVYDEISGYPESDYVLLQGDLSTTGWPNIGITHYSTDFYNPPIGTDLIVWLKVKSPYGEYVPDDTNATVAGLKAVKLEIPGSPQAYSSWEIYVVKGAKLFNISMTDVATQEAQDFYNLFLSTFKFNN